MRHKSGLWLRALVGGVVLISLLYGAFRISPYYRAYQLLGNSEDVDVTNDPEQREGILPGAVYSLTPDLYLEGRPGSFRLERSIPGNMVVLPTDKFLAPPRSRREYEENPTKWPDIVGFIGPTARYRVDKVYRHTSIEMTGVSVIGRLIDDENCYEGVTWWMPKLEKPLQ